MQIDPTFSILYLWILATGRNSLHLQLEGWDDTRDIRRMDTLWFRHRHDPCLHSPKTSLASGFCLQNIIFHTVQERSKYHIHLVVIETEVGKKRKLPLAHQSGGGTWFPWLYCLSHPLPHQSPLSLLVVPSSLSYHTWGNISFILKPIHQDL